MGKTQLQIDIDNLKTSISELRKSGIGAIDTNVMVQKVLAAMPQPVDLAPVMQEVIQEAKRYTDKHITTLNKRIDTLEASIKELLSNPLFKIVEEDPQPEPEQPPT